jgi:hypothetical protein
MWKIRELGVAALAASVLLAAGAGCNSGAASSHDIDPRADQALRTMSDVLGGAKAFSFHVVGSMDEYLETGQLSQFSRETKVLVSRPDKLVADTRGDDVSRSVWYDGRTLTLLDKPSNTYASIQVPESIEKMLDFVIEQYGLTVPMADLLVNDSYDSLIANVESGTYIDQHAVGDHTCHHLSFCQELIDWQIWIDAGETPVPRKLVITYKQEPGHPQYLATMDDWDLSPTISPGQFQSRPAAGAKRGEMADLLGIEEGE